VVNAAAPAWRERAMRAGGVSLATFVAGSDAPDAPAVLLLHGLGQWSDAAWGRLVPQLDQRARFVALDLPGFGASEKPSARYDLPFFRGVLDAAIDALGTPRISIVAHSLGGLLAADYAGAHPDRVARLGLIAPAGFSRTPRHLLYALAGGYAPWLFTRPPSRRLVLRTLAGSVADPAALEPELVERTYALAQDPAMRAAFAGVYAAALDVFIHERTLHAAFGRYDGPVLCAWGARDRYLPVRALRAVRRVYPQAQTLLLERSGHLPMREEPAPLAAALRAFLA
jgi:pimeloyl-ACP methyl ester carboxylesterase